MTAPPVCVQDALIDMVRRSRVHFVHCLLPKAEAVGGGGEPRVTHGESSDSGLMTLDVGLLRAQLRGSKLLDALRIYRQGRNQLREAAYVRSNCQSQKQGQFFLCKKNDL